MTKDEYQQMLDTTRPQVNVGGTWYNAGYLLREFDPAGFEESYNTFVSER